MSASVFIGKTMVSEIWCYSSDLKFNLLWERDGIHTSRNGHLNFIYRGTEVSGDRSVFKGGCTISIRRNSTDMRKVIWGVLQSRVVFKSLE